MQVSGLGRETCEVERGRLRNGHFLGRRFLNRDFDGRFRMGGQGQLDRFGAKGRLSGFLLLCVNRRFGLCDSRFGKIGQFDAVVENGYGGRSIGYLLVRGGGAFPRVQRDSYEVRQHG